MNKPIDILLISAMVFYSWNCVGPEEPLDGLLEDLPAIVNTSDVFTFSLKGNRFTTEETYLLSMKPDSNSVLTTSLVVQNWSGNDTTKIFMINEGDTSYQWFQITGNMIYTAIDSLTSDPKVIPKKIRFETTNFSGILQYSLIKD